MILIYFSERIDKYTKIIFFSIVFILFCILIDHKRGFFLLAMTWEWEILAMTWKKNNFEF